MPRADFGELLKALRARADVSQLELALRAEVSQRHLSFIETGRAAPSREVVEKLAESLSLGPLEVNALLLAAGMAPIKHEQSANPFAARLLEAAGFFLQQQSPNPALVIREDWQIVAANREALMLVNHFAAAPNFASLAGVKVYDLLLEDHYLKPAVANYAAVAEFMASKMAGKGPDRLEPYRMLDDPLGATRVLLPITLATEDGMLELETTLVTIGTAADAQVGEIRVETFFPKTSKDAVFLRSLTQSSAA